MNSKHPFSTYFNTQHFTWEIKNISIRKRHKVQAWVIRRFFFRKGQKLLEGGGGWIPPAHGPYRVKKN